MLRFIFNPVLIYLRVCFLGLGNDWRDFAHDALVLLAAMSEAYRSRNLVSHLLGSVWDNVMAVDVLLKTEEIGFNFVARGNMLTPESQLSYFVYWLKEDIFQVPS